ncbi:MAG: HAD family phosphatase [Bacteroidetes bacterium]|nr:HAD family phosphatase [Bacteroidota bacterium]
MQKRKYSVIVFDLGNVLLPFDYNILIKKLDFVKEGSGKHFVDTYFANYEFHRDFERGKISKEKFIERMLEILDHSIDGETFCNYFSSVFKQNKEVTALLPVLKKNYTLILLSNTNSIHEKYGWEYYDFLKYFNDLILSHKIGAVKPEEKIYRAVEKSSGSPAEEHIFVDDIEEYVNAAKSFGWDSIHFKGYNSLVRDFRFRGII